MPANTSVPAGFCRGGRNKILGLQRSNKQITANPHAIKEGRNLLFVLNFKNMQIKPSKKGQVPPPLLISADAHLTRVVFIILPPMGFSSYLFAFFFPLLYLRLYYCAAYVLPSAAVLCIGSCNRWPVLEHCSALQCACAVFGNERKGVWCKWIVAWKRASTNTPCAIASSERVHRSIYLRATNR